MGAAALDYGELLCDVKPEVVHADEVNRAYIVRLESLIARNDLTPAEEKLIELLTVLIRDYEATRYKVEKATPRSLTQREEYMSYDHLRELMELYKDVFGDPEGAKVFSQTVRITFDLSQVPYLRPCGVRPLDV